MANPSRYKQVPQTYTRAPDWENEQQKRDWINSELRRYAARLDGGDGWALFLAIQFCARWEVPLPREWARRLSDALNRYQFAEVRELGEAFGITRPRNWNHHAAREWHQKALPVFYWIEARIEEGAKTPAVFDDAAEVAGISPKRAEEYFYAIRDNRHPVRE